MSRDNEDQIRAEMLDKLTEEFNQTLEEIDPKVAKALTLLATILGSRF